MAIQHLLRRRERDPLAEHPAGVGFDPGQQLPVDPGHRRDARPAAPVEQRQQLQPVGEVLLGAGHLSGDERRQRLGRTREVGRAPEGVRLVTREVGAPHRAIFDDVAQDVRDLQRHAERLGARLGRLRVVGAEHGERQPPDRAGHAAAVRGEIGERRAPHAVDVELAALDEQFELVERQPVTGVRCRRGPPARRRPRRRRDRRAACARGRAPRACGRPGGRRRRCRRCAGPARRSPTSRHAAGGRAA